MICTNLEQKSCGWIVSEKDITNKFLMQCPEWLLPTTWQNKWDKSTHECVSVCVWVVQGSGDSSTSFLLDEVARCGWYMAYQNSSPTTHARPRQQSSCDVHEIPLWYIYILKYNNICIYLWIRIFRHILSVMSIMKIKLSCSSFYQDQQACISISIDYCKYIFQLSMIKKLYILIIIIQFT